ncbi:hypothetical protein L249_1281 [Ophiocordyceps polyrhachis-furcata BCC 54312]|uniref:Transcription elongation factor S-II n=1 Tax=Ophiocordyceps polyrhachis-furcata BCC 54312 TaxID=1330021 RepID=A0A367LFG5_9HYPO|nr:hypothetical protein L249_1281 [Ophiocordyceps polyrhachis-furcata BCC 54312]
MHILQAMRIAGFKLIGNTGFSWQREYEEGHELEECDQIQLGRGVYTTPHLNAWKDAGWQCAVFADKEKLKAIPKVVISRQVYQQTLNHDPTMEIHAYIRNLYKDVDPRRCLLIGYIDEGPELQMLIPFDLLDAYQGGLNITVECASSENMNALANKVDIMLDHNVRVNYSSWEGVLGDLSDDEGDYYDYQYDFVGRNTSSEVMAYHSLSSEHQTSLCSGSDDSEVETESPSESQSEDEEPGEYCNLGEHTSRPLEEQFRNAFVQAQTRSVDELQGLYPVIAFPLLALLASGICLPNEHRIRRETPRATIGKNAALQCCQLSQELMGFLVAQNPEIVLDDWEATDRLRALGQVIDVRINNIDGESYGELYGKITVRDPVGEMTLYDVARGSAQESSPGSLVRLSDGKRVIEGSNPFSIDVRLWDRDRISADDLISNGTIEWSLDGPHNQIFSTEVPGTYGSATIRWTVLKFASAANIQVVLINGDGESPANIFGSCQLKTETVARTWFDVKEGGQSDVYKGNVITETSVAVAADTFVEITVNIWDHDVISEPDSVAKGTVAFYPDPGKTARKRVKGDNGEVEVVPFMDQRELEARIKALTKSVAANEPPENAIRLLDMLKKDAAPTEEMLRATRAGVFVGKLRGNPNKEIARAAMELVNKWKKLVEQEKNSKLQKAKMGSPALPAASPPSSAPQNAAASTATRKAFTGDPEKRKYDSDGVDIKRTASNVRNQCIGLVYNGLAFRSTESASDVIAKAVAVEQAVFDSFGSENAEYKKKVRSLFANLKNKSNKELGRRVMTGDITPERFASMTDDDLKSEDQRKKDLELEKENMKKAQVPMAEKSISDSLECGRCKKKRVSYTQAQTRAADEPMTTFCECMNCGHRWKFS